MVGISRAQVRWGGLAAILTSSAIHLCVVALVGWVGRGERPAQLVFSNAWAGADFEVSLAEARSEGGAPSSEKDSPSSAELNPDGNKMASEPQLNAPPTKAPGEGGAEEQPDAPPKSEAQAGDAPIHASEPSAQPEALANKKSVEKKNSRPRRSKAASSRTRPPRPRASAAAGSEEQTRAPAAPSSGSADAGGSGAGQPGGSGEPAGSAGALGLPKGVRHLPVAFTRVLPRAGVSERGFASRGLGELGEVQFTFHLDSQGKITRTEFHGDTDPLLKSLVERAVRFLGQSQFSVNETALEGQLFGSLRVSLQIRLSQTSPSEESDNPNATRILGFEPPKAQAGGKQRGLGYFELESGLRFDAVVIFDPAE